MVSDNNLNNEYITVVNDNPKKVSLFLENDTVVDKD